MDCLRNSKLLRVQKCSGIRFEACGILLSMDTEALTFLWFGERFKKIFRRSNNFACSDLKTAREQMEMGLPDLILLDINLPDGSGLDFLKKCKQTAPWIPVILLTANDTDLDIVEGLDLGADDYVTKPFSLSVLRARVRTQLRNHAEQNGTAEKAIFSQGKYRFDFAHMIFTVGGEIAELSKTEQKLLKVLTDNCGRTVSRDVLIDRVWENETYVDGNALSVSIKRLRDKLDASDVIRTVYGIGYTWVKENA